MLSHRHPELSDAEALRVDQQGTSWARAFRRHGDRFVLDRLTMVPPRDLSPTLVLAAGAGVEMLCDGHPARVILVPYAEWTDAVCEYWPLCVCFAIIGVGDPRVLQGLPALVASAERYPGRMFVSGSLPRGTAGAVGIDLARIGRGAA